MRTVPCIRIIEINHDENQGSPVFFVSLRGESSERSERHERGDASPLSWVCRA